MFPYALVLYSANHQGSSGGGQATISPGTSFFVHFVWKNKQSFQEQMFISWLKLVMLRQKVSMMSSADQSELHFLTCQPIASPQNSASLPENYGITDLLLVNCVYFCSKGLHLFRDPSNKPQMYNRPTVPCANQPRRCTTKRLTF